jgi:hypothetical protein
VEAAIWKGGAYGEGLTNRIGKEPCDRAAAKWTITPFEEVAAGATLTSLNSAIMVRIRRDSHVY